jgi:hypothetical protein
MVYNTQDYCFFWTFPSPGILETKKHDVSEPGSVSVLKWKGGEDTLQTANISQINSYFELAIATKTKLFDPL